MVEKTDAVNHFINMCS